MSYFGDQAITSEVTNADGSKTTTLSNGQTITTAADGTITVNGQGGDPDKPGSGSGTVTATPEQQGKIEGILKTFFGLEPQDLKRALGMYLMSRATGASHQGSTGHEVHT